MPRHTRPRREPTDDYQQLSLWANGPEHRAFELIRPVVLFGQSPAERARETGAAERTIRRKADRFDAYGMASLFAADEARPVTPDRIDRRALPPDVCQLIVDLKREYPPLRPKELATICYLKCGRKPAPHTIQRVLAEGPPPSYTTRRYPPYDEIADPAEARLAIIRLHAEGWSVGSIGGYLAVSRKTVWRTLRRWVEEGVKGLDDKPHMRKRVALKTTLRAVATVKRLQQNPELGAWRIHAALKRLGISLSARTCGRILALNRRLYGLDGPKAEPHEKKPMPFAATRRHQTWAVDVRYLEDGKIHHLGGGNIYVISVLDCYSRAILVSAISRTQDLTAYLMVLFAAIRQHGSPETLVSDGGSSFNSSSSSTFSRTGRIARQDNRHSPAEVLGWVSGRLRTPEELHRIFYATRFGRVLDKAGYLRFRCWRLYGEAGLARYPAAVWLYRETLTVEFADQPIAQYSVAYQPDHTHLLAVTDPRLFETQYRSSQLPLWELGDGDWLKILWLGPNAPRRPKRAVIGAQLPLFEPDAIG
jgi:transposase InsO family protein